MFWNSSRIVTHLYIHLYILALRVSTESVARDRLLLKYLGVPMDNFLQTTMPLKTHPPLRNRQEELVIFWYTGRN